MVYIKLKHILVPAVLRDGADLTGSAEIRNVERPERFFLLTDDDRRAAFNEFFGRLRHNIPAAAAADERFKTYGGQRF